MLIYNEAKVPASQMFLMSPQMLTVPPLGQRRYKREQMLAEWGSDAIGTLDKIIRDL